jgi:hypothetical protein
MDMAEVITQHNDISRSGANLLETRLTTANVRVATFGKLFQRTVDGHIYAQPLYVPGLAVPGHGTRDVVFVATMHNSVYAFDADDPTATVPFWHRSLETSSSLPDANIGFLCGAYADIAVEIGIVSTPVIDLSARTIYLVTFTRVGLPGSSNARYQHWLHALDIATGAERAGGPRQISAAIDTQRFDSKCQNQRAGLLLAGGRLYIAFASYCDSGPYHGWVLAYSASTLQPAGAFSVSPSGDRGGVWQAGTGLAADSSHNVYFLTGNGTFDATRMNLGDCLVKLTANVGLADWFSPFNNQDLSAADDDLGSAGVLLLPGTNLLVCGGKQGRLYLIDRSHLGHFNPAGDTQIVQSFQATGVTNAAGVAPPANTHHIHGSPVHWHAPDGDRVYVWGENDWLRAYRFDGHQFPTVPGAAEITFKTILPETAIGGPAVSSNGTRLGVAWTGTDAQTHVNFETSADGHTFTGKVTLNETSIDGPGLAFGAGRWFVAWTGTDSQRHVNVIASLDGTNFINKVTLNETSPFGSALAFGNGRLFLAWVGTDANRSLNILSSADGITFVNKVTLIDSSASAPGLSFIDGRLYLLWQGTDANRSLNIMESLDGVTFSNKVTLPESSDFHPTLTKIGQFCLAWTGRDVLRSLNTLTGPSTHSFANKRTFGDRAAAAPILANHGSSTFLGWSGTDNPSHVNITHVLGQPLPVTSTMLAPTGMPGGMLSISANGSTRGSGILWASLPFQGDANQHVVPAILRAFDAADVQHELWNSKLNAARDDVGNFAKFCSPTVADGKVFLPTFSGRLAVYGLL